eukprot:g300.t1
MAEETEAVSAAKAVTEVAATELPVEESVEEAAPEQEAATKDAEPDSAGQENTAEDANAKEAEELAVESALEPVEALAEETVEPEPTETALEPEPAKPSDEPAKKEGEAPKEEDGSKAAGEDEDMNSADDALKTAIDEEAKKAEAEAQAAEAEAAAAAVAKKAAEEEKAKADADSAAAAEELKKAEADAAAAAEEMERANADAAKAAAEEEKAKTDAAAAEEAKSTGLDADFWHSLADKLPVGKDPAERKQRMAMFDLFDPNGNGYLSLAEVDKGIRDVLQCEEMFDAKPAIMRAFQAAKDARKTKSKLGADFVERIEFRLLLIYLRRYFELYVMFDVLNGDDRRIDEAEFVAAVPKLAGWGVEVSDPAAEFKAIDTNGGGQVLFDEFSAWALRRGLDLEADDEDEDEEEDEAKAAPAVSSAEGAGEKKRPDEAKAPEAQAAPPAAAKKKKKKDPVKKLHPKSPEARKRNLEKAGENAAAPVDRSVTSLRG